MELNQDNYYTKDSDMEYCSYSQYKLFQGTSVYAGCPARAMAEIKGEIVHKVSAPMMMGSYVDAYFSGMEDFSDFLTRYQDEVFYRSKKNRDKVKSLYKKANEMINRARRDKFWMYFMEGEKQKIYTGEIGGVMFKCRMDNVNPDFTTDLKTCRTLNRDKKVLDVTLEGDKVPFVETLGYEIQAAIYQEIRYQNEGGKKLPFFINAISKDTDPLDGSFHPRIAVIQVPQYLMDDRLKEVEQYASRIKQIKDGEAEAAKCERCTYCNDTMELERAWQWDDFYVLDD